ncbi:uncharacterized protein Z518_03997 [Rhinocladiella mackenziei CBS 650.93]|uniref:Mediator of RNA polymerase II transcription subunit 20 n=1 Tax=Rhinocladiella mackenziei CBS 650.93 TaxID=1442369 RepID=A0A0D2H6M8_9EURO|nr:uncharacterized protein Z518_03997 [Rhinocladiella mackenziei CBS 650.93]KIX06023.1 hypothetical protein Z518_03997 [Rhinocladiella mackenziei CBS 650.93]
MPSTGLFLFPVGPNQLSPSSVIISHISRSFPAEPLPPFYLDHRLFVDTSSLLPNSDTSLRRFTSILTLSHTPLKTYVGITPSKEKGQPLEQQPLPSTLITVPSTFADSFTQLIGTKLQPHWAHRQSLVVENGTALSFRNGEWTVRIGDLKTPIRPNQTVSNVRGMLIEVSYTPGTLETRREDSVKQENTNIFVSVDKENATIIRAFLEALTVGTGVSLENSRVLFRRTNSHDKEKGGSGAVDGALATLYMEMLRGGRG